jgi:hypothetical protein
MLIAVKFSLWKCNCGTYLERLRKISVRIPAVMAEEWTRDMPSVM